MILWVIILLMQAFSRSCMPMLHRPICLCCHKNVVSFHCSSDWPPCHGRNRHLFLSTRSHQSECQLAWINIINPSHAITVSTCQVFIIWIESCAKYSCIRITESNSMCYFAEGILRLRDLRFGLRLLRVYVFSMSIKHVDTLLICLAWSWVVMHLIGIQKIYWLI